MKVKIKFLLNRFANWLWSKTHEVTATEVMLLRDADRLRKCEHCGLAPIHYLEDCDCLRRLKPPENLMTKPEHITQLKELKRWLKGRKMPEEQKNLIRELVNVKLKELKLSMSKKM